jgi:hypothetical protein
MRRRRWCEVVHREEQERRVGGAARLSARRQTDGCVSVDWCDCRGFTLVQQVASISGGIVVGVE